MSLEPLSGCPACNKFWNGLSLIDRFLWITFNGSLILFLLSLLGRFSIVELQLNCSIIPWLFCVFPFFIRIYLQAFPLFSTGRCLRPSETNVNVNWVCSVEYCLLPIFELCYEWLCSRRSFLVFSIEPSSGQMGSFWYFIPSIWRWI